LDFGRILFAIALMSLGATVACGSGGSGSIILPNPSGVTYSKASLKGSYVYQVHGFDSTGFPYRQVGVFTADGSGNITGGSDDSSVSATGTAVTGNYNVAQDGTGFINLNTSLGPITWAITLSSTSKLSLIEADNFANAGGTAEFQPPSAQWKVCLPPAPRDQRPEPVGGGGAGGSNHSLGWIGHRQHG